jgi:putative membrane protein
MKSILSAVCCIALCCSPLLAQHKAGKAAKGKAAAEPMTDQQFVDFAGQTDMLEANLGQLASSQAASQGVKDYAQMLVTDHTSDYNQLTAAAGKASLNVPKGLDAEHEKMAASMQKAKGAAFDHQYIHDMIAGHEKAIAVYTTEASDAQSPDIKNYASTALPVLQKHLSGAQDLAKAKPSAKGKM